MSITIVVGASSGIGQAAAIRAAEGGSGVIATYHSNKDGAAETVSRIQDVGGTAVALPLDVGDSATFPAFRAAVEQALTETWGTRKVTGLVNNAGFGGGTMFADTTEEELDRFYRVIFKGPYLVTQALLPLLDDGAAIVNTSSNSALPSGLSEGYSAYGSMKGAVIVLTRYLAKELGGRGIRVNSVSPGPTRTPFAGGAFEEFPEMTAQMVGRTALGRLGEPDDVGSVIAFLLSDGGRWITAQDIEVSGGFNL
ncbi:SDR family NAD(P)-dependent oxidoreductase [Promicromonospora iranensis]|uniref:NAD(P)-dependent dehydrogenase (Short-subunit alcohol dehydrogenase family) n=1 Tax=Promicromonospora iranensis TaxID=1105144 RepID=A0ABU2CWM0_9MICO|nr:SDR family oxidoreductase [Promicromonospora iranensis]MDR7385752.1 NAD(P)-dependent dehydrogenase (short-subunit alcohol dehydrogenase family) [Promicromonospora iranensis]